MISLNKFNYNGIISSIIIIYMYTIMEISMYTFNLN